MKTMMTLFAVSFAAALLAGASTPASARTPDEDTGICSLPVYDCCDGLTTGTRLECMMHGGTCGAITVCGKPV